MAQTQVEVLLSEAELRGELQSPQACVTAGHCQGPVLRTIRGQTLRKAEITVHRRSKPVSKANNSRDFLKFCGPVSNALWSKTDCSRPANRPPRGATCTSQRFGWERRRPTQHCTEASPWTHEVGVFSLLFHWQGAMLSKGVSPPGTRRNLQRPVHEAGAPRHPLRLPPPESSALKRHTT